MPLNNGMVRIAYTLRVPATAHTERKAGYQVKAKHSDRTERIGVGIALAAFESIGFAFREQSESDYE